MTGPERVAAPGFADTVEVFRDEYGIPHVRAGSVTDAFRGQGYVTAADRMFQLAADRRRAQGRWAELAGPAALRLDVLMRRLDLPAAAEHTMAGATPETKAVFAAYADGVNAWLDRHGLPAEFSARSSQPWQPADSWLVYLYRHVLMGPFLRKMARTAAAADGAGAGALRLLRGNAGTELVAWPAGASWTGPDLGSEPAWLAELAAQLADSAVSGAVAGTDGSAQSDIDGSNSWAVSPGRSSTGRPILAGDPHRLLDVPNVYHQVHLRAAGSDGFDAVGLALAGVPGLPHFGHNERVAWCITHGMTDDQDLYLEQLADGRYRESADDWLDLPSRTELVQVRGGAPVEVQVARTSRGPLVALDAAGRVGVSLRWVAMDGSGDTTPDCLLPMLRAGSAAQLEQQMRGWVVPANNLLAADVQGEVRFRLRGRVPVRPAANGWTAVAGWDPAGHWYGSVPFEQLPAALVDDVLATANTRPSQAVTAYLGHDFAGRWRLQRILQLLNSEQQHDPADAGRIHGDVFSGAAAAFVQALPPRPFADPKAERLRALLAGWDGTMAADSAAAAAYSLVREQLVTGWASALGLPSPLRVLDFELLAAERASWLWSSFPAWVEAGGCGSSAQLEAAFTAAADRGAELFGAEVATWRWDQLHVSRFGHPLGGATPADVALPGDNETVRLGAMDGTSFRAVHASVARYVFDVGNWEGCGWVVPHGVAGDPASPHFTDQLEPWRQVRLVPMRYDWAEISALGDPALLLSPPAG